MLDQWGHVIGIVNAKVDTVKMYSQTKQLIRDVGFGISTAAILRFLDEPGRRTASTPSARRSTPSSSSTARGPSSSGSAAGADARRR